MDTKIVFSITPFLLAIFQSAAAENKSSTLAHSNAVESCATLADRSTKELGVYAEHSGIPIKQWRKIVGVMCMNGITAARDAGSEKELDEYWYVMKQKYFDANAGALAAPLDPAWSISKKYFQSIHGIKEKEAPPYPSLSKNPTAEEKVAAVEEYASKKLLRGMPIKHHCEFMTEKMPNGNPPLESLRSAAIRTCEGVMIHNFTKGKHGISGVTAMNIIEKTYGKNSNEYRYFDHVTHLAFSESQ